jgi:hypothetical protein
MKKVLLLVISMSCGFLAAFAQPANNTFCEEHLLTFAITGTTNYTWYDAATGGNVVGTGPSVSVSRQQAYLSATTPDTVYSLFAEGASTGSLKGGFSSSAAAIGSYGTAFAAPQGSSTLQMLFSTTVALTIDTLTISVSSGTLGCTSNPNPKITLTVFKPSDANFKITKSNIVFTCVGSGEGFYKIPVGITLSSPGDYGIKVGSAIGGASYKLDYYSPSNSLYPKAISNVISFTSDNDGYDSTHLVPSLLDWVVSTASSVRTEVTTIRNCPSNGIELLDLGVNGIAEAYPNPFREELTFAWKKAEPVTIRLSDVNGREIEEFTLSSVGTVALGKNTAPGLYFVRATTSSASYLTKIMKR